MSGKRWITRSLVLGLAVTAFFMQGTSLMAVEFGFAGVSSDAPGGDNNFELDPVHGVINEVSGVTLNGNALTEGIDYVVSGEGSSECFVTFTNAPAAGDTVTVSGTKSQSGGPNIDW